MEPALILCLIAGTLCTALWMARFRQRLGISKPAILIAAILHTIAGVVCVKLFAGLESFQLTLSGGMSLYGAIFFLPLFYALGAKAFKRDVRQVFDVMTLCVISTLLIVRVNCIVSGCCEGMLLPGSNQLRWPTREIEMVFHGVLLVLFYRRLCRPAVPGTVYPLYMMAYGAFRFVEEWFREGDAIFLGLHPAHLWSILSIVIGCAVYFELVERDRRRQARVKTRR